MSIFNNINFINEGLFNKSKKKSKDRDKEEINKYIKIAEDIMKSNANKYKNIINKIISKFPEVKRYYEFYNNCNIDYIKRFGGQEVLAGTLFSIDIFSMYENEEQEDDQQPTKGDIAMYECIKELNVYNKSKNIAVSFWDDDGSAHFEIPISSLESHSIDENHIFESVKFI